MAATRVSPTTAAHVRDELGDRVALVLDGGACPVGIESTVVDVTGERPTILRPGGLSRERLEAAIGPVGVRAAIVDPARMARAPGQHEVHYAPRVRAVRFARGRFDVAEAAIAADPRLAWALVTVGAPPPGLATRARVSMPANSRTLSRNA